MIICITILFIYLYIYLFAFFLKKGGNGEWAQNHASSFEINLTYFFKELQKAPIFLQKWRSKYHLESQIITKIFQNKTLWWNLAN